MPEPFDNTADFKCIRFSFEAIKLVRVCAWVCVCGGCLAWKIWLWALMFFIRAFMDAFVCNKKVKIFLMKLRTVQCALVLVYSFAIVRSRSDECVTLSKISALCRSKVYVYATIKGDMQLKHEHFYQGLSDLSVFSVVLWKCQLDKIKEKPSESFGFFANWPNLIWEISLFDSFVIWT